MADQILISQLVDQVEYQGASGIYLSQLADQVEYLGPSGIYTSQNILQVEYKAYPNMTFTGGINLENTAIDKGSLVGGAKLLNNKNKISNLVGGFNLADSPLFLTLNYYTPSASGIYVTLSGTAYSASTLTINDSSDNITRDSDNWSSVVKLIPYETATFIIKAEFEGIALYKTAKIYCEPSLSFSLSIKPSRIVMTELLIDEDTVIIDDPTVFTTSLRPTITNLTQTPLRAKYGYYDIEFLIEDLNVDDSSTLVFVEDRETITVIDTEQSLLYKIYYNIDLAPLGKDTETLLNGITFMYNTYSNDADRKQIYEYVIDENKYVIHKARKMNIL